MTVRIDAGIPLSSPTAPPGAVGDVDSALTLAGQAGARDYVLEGERAVVRGGERRGGARISIDGRVVVEGVEADVGMGVNVVLSPALARRECVGPRGAVVETTLALPTLPMAAVQWRGVDGLDVSLTLLPTESGVGYQVGEGTLRAEPADGDRGVEILLDPPPEEWSVTEGPEGGVRVHARIHPRLGARTAAGASVTLLVSAGPPESTARSLDAGRHLGAHAVRAATDQDPVNVDALLPVTGVAELDQGAGWATVRLAGALRGGSPMEPAHRFWAGVGALASGDPRGAVLAAARIRDHGAVMVLPGAGAPGPALALWLSARSALLSGDEATAVEALAQVDAALMEEARAESDPSAWAWWSMALGTLADALRYAASEDETGALRAAAARPAGRSPRTLPMVGAGPTPGSAAWLGALLSGALLPPGGPGDVGDPTRPNPARPDPTRPDPARQDPAHQDAAQTALAPWLTLAAGDVDAGYGAWRALLGEGLAGAAGPRGAWAPEGAGPGLLLATLAFGLLGLEPDAPSGRVRIAPKLPGHLKAFGVRGIRVGDGRLVLGYTREEDAGGRRTHRFELDALDGRVPPTAILEPSLPLPLARIGAVRVDGRPAELTADEVGGRTRLRVQIPVDGNRVLEIDEG